MSKAMLRALLSFGLLWSCGSEQPEPVPPLLPMPDDDPSMSGSVELAPGDRDHELPTGGQSGTDAPDNDPFICPYPVPMDERLTYGGVKVTGLLQTVRGPHALPGRIDPPTWPEGDEGPAATLEIDIELAGAPEHVFGPSITFPSIICNNVRVPVRLELRMVPSDDPAMTRTVSADATLILDSDGFSDERHGSIHGGFELENYSGPALSDDWGGGVSVRFSYRTEPIAPHHIVLDEVEVKPSDDSFFARFYRPSEVAPRIEPLPECLALEREPPGVGSFASAEEALLAVVGRWAICNPEDPAVTGVEIFADGSWNAILGRDSLEHGAGFGREGFAELRDISEPYGSPGDFLLVLTQPRALWFAASTDIEFSASGSSFGGWEYLDLARMARPAAASRAPDFERGQRAGLSACSSAESELEPFANEAELHAGLAGEWVGCSGYDGRLRFDTGTAEFVETDTYVGRSEPYHWMDTEGVATRIQIGNEKWRLARSMRPLKLWAVRGDYPKDWSEPFYDPEVLVFSAVPGGD